MIFLLKNFLIFLMKYQMAKQRIISTKIWDDTYFTELNPNEKLIFIYLLTNWLTNLSWIYEIQIKRISYDTWIWIQDIKKIIDKFTEDKKIYLFEGFIMIKNFIKNQNLNPSVKKWIEREISLIPKNILSYFLSLNKDNLIEYINDINSLLTAYPQSGLLNLTKPNLTKLNLTQIPEKEIITTKVVTLKELIKQEFTQEFIDEVYKKFNLTKDDFIESSEDFLLYWTEKNKNWTKERWQKQETFDVKLRYRTWMRNSSKWNKTNLSSKKIVWITSI